MPLGEFVDGGGRSTRAAAERAARAVLHRTRLEARVARVTSIRFLVRRNRPRARRRRASPRRGYAPILNTSTRLYAPCATAQRFRRANPEQTWRWVKWQVPCLGLEPVRNTKRSDPVKAKRPRLALQLGTEPYGIDFADTVPPLGEPGRADPSTPTVPRIRAAEVVDEAEPASAGRYSHVFGRSSSR